MRGGSGAERVLVFLGIFWASFLIGFSGALVPGPTLTVTVREAARRGPWAGPLVVLGHGIIEVAITVILILGLSSFTDDIRVRKTIAIVGGAFLALMGLTMLRKLGRIDQEITRVETGGIKRNARPILLGMTTTLSNPYWFGWWGSVGASLLVASSASGTKGIVAFITGHVSSDLAWYSIVAYLVSAGLSYRKGSWYKVTFGICGAFLVVVGALFARYGLRLSG
jgi:threonine/homoserine/homoserine lactone efflux protein